MNIGFVLYRLGALGMFLTLGILWNDPVVSQLKAGSAQWPTVLILFGFAVIAGAILLSVRSAWIDQNQQTFMLVTHSLALLSIVWLLLWCFVWLTLIAARGDSAEMFIKHIADLHLFGVGFTMAAYAAGWVATRLGERSARFSMAAGWAVSYMAWLNLYLQPELRWLWAPAIGGLLVVVGAFLVVRKTPVK